MSRREFAKKTGITASGLLLLADAYALNVNKHKIRAIAFDGFPVFDPRPVYERIDKLFPEKGKQLNEIWKSYQFSYQWLRVAADKYKNFLDLTRDALDFAATTCGLTLTMAEKETIMDEYNLINIWSDVIPALQIFKNENIKLCVLSNMTSEMLEKGMRNSNAKYLFEHIISTDEKRTFKPSPIAYQMVRDRLGFKKEEILFVPFAAWDMAGAKWFGYPTFWVNRLNAPKEGLDAIPDGTGKTLFDLVEFVKMYNS